MGKARLDLENSDFFEMLAHAADETKQSLVLDVLALIRKGDGSATRLLEKALLNNVLDEKNRPIPILMGATQKPNVVPSNDSAK